MAARTKGPRTEPARVRYGVVGLGHIAQVALLPAFRHARANSQVAALVSGDPIKLDRLGRRYRIRHRLGYDDIARLWEDDLVDAVYVGLPNDRHHDTVVRLAGQGLHVLCEKPLAVTEAECKSMIEAAERGAARLMTAYRLHFDRATVEALETVRQGRIGAARYLTSTFSMQLTDEDNIRLSAARGGGPLFDLGVYCINAARMVFAAEPTEVFGMEIPGSDPRFAEVPELVTAILRFPEDRVASFTCSFNGGKTSAYRIVGTAGDLVVEPGFEYAAGLAHRLTVGGRVTRRRFAKKDQFGAELLAFSSAILEGGNGYPTGWEGLADVRVAAAITESARTGRVVTLERWPGELGPDPDQVRSLPPVQKPKEVRTRAPGE